MAKNKVPLHPMFVHFPLALLGTSLIFDIIGLASGSPVWWTIAFWNIALGLIIAAIAATTGLIDSQRVQSDSTGAKLVIPHMLSMVAAVIAYGVALIIRGGTGTPSGASIAGTMVLEGVGLLLLIVGGTLGGEMVYRHGIGQISDVRPPAATPPGQPRRETRVPPAIMPPPRPGDGARGTEPRPPGLD